MTPEPRPVQVDLLAQPWYAHPNDLIGGWSVLNIDGPPQADHRADQYEVGNFLGEDTARHIAELHNTRLEAERRATIRAGALRSAAADLLATGAHEDLCDYGPPGSCNCALGEHYRWLLARAEALPGVVEEANHG